MGILGLEVLHSGLSGLRTDSLFLSLPFRQPSGNQVKVKPVGLYAVETV